MNDTRGARRGRLRWCLIASMSIGVGAARAQLSPATRPIAATDLEPEPRVDAAVAAGLAYLARQQNEDGSWDTAAGVGGPRVALTALSLMAYLANGHTADAGKYGLNVRRAVDYLVRVAPADGYFGKLDGSRMYGQCIAALALAEALGVEPDARRRREVREALDRAVAVILRAHDAPKSGELEAGGWRYEPQSGDSDLSLSGWAALALRAAQNVGLNVPKSHARRAAEYVVRCWREDDGGGFGYQPRTSPTPGMTGVAVLNLYLMEATDGPEAAAGVRYLTEHPVTEQTRFQYYSMYYTTQAAYQAGGDAWAVNWPNNRDQLLALQTQDGGWPQSRSGEEPGRIYATSMAVLTLSVPYRLLPVYQR